MNRIKLLNQELIELNLYSDNFLRKNVELDKSSISNNILPNMGIMGSFSLSIEKMIEYQKICDAIKEKRKEISIENERLHVIYKRKELIEKIELNNHIKKQDKQDGKFFVLQDEEDLYKSYCFKTNIINQNDDFLVSSDFKVFMDMMETNWRPYAGIHNNVGESNWFGYSSDQIKDFKTAIQMWYDFFKKNNKTTNDSEIVIVENDNIIIFKKYEI